MIKTLNSFHPLVIEGMGGYDPRDAKPVALQIIRGLEAHWRLRPPSMPVLLVTQGDPYTEKGISAITRIVADELSLPRAMVFLDPEIAAYHEPNADHYRVVHKIPYSELTKTLSATQTGLVERLSGMVEAQLEEKNNRRRELGKPELAEYFPAFAMLQEVTKTACKQLCGGITIAHTSQDISPFSITSFFQVGLELGLICKTDMVPFGA